MFPIRTLLLIHCIAYTFEDVLRQERILSFQNCESDSDCFANSFCHTDQAVGRKRCRCNENFILTPFNRTTYGCLPVGGDGASCTVDIQCQVKLGSLATCDEVENICKCISDAHIADDNMCHQTVELGKVCQNNYNCLLSDNTYGFCDVGKCVCNVHQHPVEGENRCIHTSHLNGECAYQENCKPQFSNCYGGICKCVPGFVESENNKVCLVAASAVGENCTETIQCSEYVKGSFCLNDTCECQSDHHGYGNECVSDSKLGEICFDDKQCIITAELENSVQCLNQICSCIEGKSDAHYYGCVIRSGSEHILPLTLCILFVYTVFLQKLM